MRKTSDRPATHTVLLEAQMRFGIPRRDTTKREREKDAYRLLSKAVGEQWMAEAKENI